LLDINRTGARLPGFTREQLLMMNQRDLAGW
jgi:hypothetical protein